MNLIVDGRRYRNFLSASVTSGMNTLARTFEFQASTKGFNGVPFRAGQACTVKIDDETLMTGYIEKIDFTTDEEGNTYTLQGRDLLGDLVDSNLPELSDLGLTVKSTCQRVLSYLGIDVEVIDEASAPGDPVLPFDDYDVVSPEASDTAFEFLRSVAVRRQVLLSSDEFANLILTRGLGSRINQRLVNRVDGIGNNLTKCQYTVDHSQRFFKYQTDSQLNISAKGTGDALNDAIAYVRSTVEDKEIRTTRRRSVSSENSYSENSAKQRATWERNIARTHSRVYNVTIPSHRDQDGLLFKSNTAPIVEDEFAGIANRMLISNVKYILDANGRSTELSLVEERAFRLELEDAEGFSAG